VKGGLSFRHIASATEKVAIQAGENLHCSFTVDRSKISAGLR
jgi:hypothetical protein